MRGGGGVVRVKHRVLLSQLVPGHLNTNNEKYVFFHYYDTYNIIIFN